MSWYRTGTVAVTNGSKTVTGVGTLFTTAVNVGDAFALVDANLNPTGAWYEVDVVVSNTEITLKQSYAGTTGSNNQYCVFNMVGNMTTPSFAQRLATFFASFQSLIDKPTTTPTAASIPIADANGDIDSGWIKDASTTVKGVVELATSAEVLAGTDTQRGITPATLTAKILGTVSQAAGVPTGAIIESGSNANGYYIKFADGTMMCSSTDQIGTSVATNTSSWGPSGVFTYYASVSYTFPASFFSVPNVVVASIDSGSGVCSAGQGAMPTKTGVNVQIIGSCSLAKSSYIAIGRWY